MSSKPNPKNREKLLKLIDVYRLSNRDIANMLDKSIFTVNSWRSVSVIDISDQYLELLEYKLADKYGKREI